MTIQHRYDTAPTFEQFLEAAEKNRELWHGITRRVVIPDAAVERASRLPGRWHLLVLSADWCGDAVNTVPVVARLAELAPNLDLRVVDRDANPDLMDAHLTGTSRSIPVVIAYDDQWREHAWWGPRPSELQRWVLGTGLSLPKDERYREIRTWYARDRGRSTLEEVIRMLETAAGVEAVAEPEELPAPIAATALAAETA